MLENMLNIEDRFPIISWKLDKHTRDKTHENVNYNTEDIKKNHQH